MPQNLEDIELRSEEVQEVLTKVPHWMIRYGNVCFLVLILMLLGLSWMIKYPDIISSEAIITTEAPPEKIYAKTTGKVEAILVKENELVRANQTLAILENTANYKDVFVLKALIDSTPINNKTFQFPIDDLPLLFLGDIESQYALFENSYIQYILNKKLQPFSNEAQANTYSIAELNRRLQNLKSQQEINKTELIFKEKDLQRNKSLFENGVISAQDYENKQLEFAQAERNYQNFETSISQLRESISNAHTSSKRTEISHIKEEMTLLKNVIQSFNQLKKAIKDWELRYVLKSSIEGNISFFNVWNNNQNVQQGDIVFTVIPSSNSNFIAQLKTPAQNSGKVKAGQRVNIKLENYPDAEFGTLQGTVKRISFTPNDKGEYTVIVNLSNKLTTSYKKEIAFKQEMIGMAEVITEDLRLIDRFFHQFTQLIKR